MSKISIKYINIKFALLLCSFFVFVFVFFVRKDSLLFFLPGKEVEFYDSYKRKIYLGGESTKYVFIKFKKDTSFAEVAAILKRYELKDFFPRQDIKMIGDNIEELKDLNEILPENLKKHFNSESYCFSCHIKNKEGSSLIYVDGVLSKDMKYLFLYCHITQNRH